MEILTSKGVTAVPGFKASGIASGIKKSKKDMSVIYSSVPAVSAATFTSNVVKAAPVLFDMENIKNETAQAIIVNSGNANACTGEQGMANAKAMAEKTASCLGINAKNVLVASTGIIGIQLPMDTVLAGIEAACEAISEEGGSDAAQSIMTTDSFQKEIAVSVSVGGKKVTIGAMAKGSGMIHPNMGTMLSFIATDVSISKQMLSKALKDSVDDSYNMISVDGDTSTNDTAFVLANGLAGNETISSESSDYYEFKKALDYVNTELAKMIASDGEGATKLLETSIINAPSLETARLCARSVISSNLVKAAFFGNNTNWGRIMCSIGYSGADFNPDIVDIYFKNESGEIKIAENGMEVGFSEDDAQKILQGQYVNITVDLKAGEYSATAWGCDLSYDYVKVNAMYKS
ncbi:arginine biosynthesis bifunctional protein ArgJ [Peptoclostridium acidaminophilum DSM 3953]|uniref:Arginine biosynthesis bifunctional protein ArgJ n=1 Tax=Peptoclostridium acidaminophilum DSM 3953 TaxID=1286171 RepID=W8T6J7_PEPAC|nr:bifunctional glutamate N-acetyltransferase/amino-acid acetyltransferase ArgJ [Peptoclostridium acidaminophilum]AHM56505.1 arginine biosynthesis bifunctional protein ArgJ [Peptoclostridium acidaminophilum DSM 3953]